jgi:predicted transcriptional regulator
MKNSKRVPDEFDINLELLKIADEFSYKELNIDTIIYTYNLYNQSRQKLLKQFREQEHKKINQKIDTMIYLLKFRITTCYHYVSVEVA